MAFFQRLTRRVLAADSLLCVGLDPHVDQLAEPTAEAAERFCLDLIEATAEVACAFKPNSAFFEVFGPEGLRALRAVIQAVPEGIPVLLDAKRGDIASSSRAYAQAAFETLGADAVTASPYLGWDSLNPLLADPERGVFLLCKTSNPGSADLQERVTEGGEPLYVRLAAEAEARAARGNLGLVVGATDPNALAAVREAAPTLWLLAPGVGAQGGDQRAALQAGLREDGMGMILPVSRGISTAEDPRAEAAALRDSMEEVRREVRARPRPVGYPRLDALARGLVESGCVRFGSFTLKSGTESPFYIDLRRLASMPRLLAQTAAAYQHALRGLDYDLLAAVPYAALPIGTALALQTGKPMVYPRKEAKDYGTKAQVEGIYRLGQRALVVDDLVTTAESKFEAIHQLEAVGLVVEEVLVLIDRGSGAATALAEQGYRLHAVYTMEELLDLWEAGGWVDASQIERTRTFLRAGGRKPGGGPSDG